MATKSPGIYYTEKDNTYYSNPKSAIGTTLAVIGFARKGPTDKPVEINSWKNFVDTFGEAIEGKYSGLAIKNYLAAGGTVVFKRVADEELAKPSSYVIKNGAPAKAAYAYFKKKGDILSGTPGYIGGSLYAFTLNYGSESKRDIFIRSPKKGIRFTQQAIVKQISDQLKDVKASYEGLLGSLGVEKILPFKLTIDRTSSEFFIKTSKESTSKKSFVENFKKRLEYTNSYVKMEVASSSEGSGESYKPADGTYAFSYKRGAGDAQSVSVKLTNGDKTLESITKKINQGLEKSDIIAISNGNAIYFIDMIEGNRNALEISGANTDSAKNLFAKTSTASEDFPADFPTSEKEGILYASSYTKAEPKKVEGVESVIYDEVTDSMIITASSGDKIALENNNLTYGDKTSKLIDKNSIIIGELKIDKKAELSGINVYVDINKQIRLEYEDTSNVSSIKLENRVAGEEETITVSSFFTLMEEAESESHVAKTEDSSRDAIIITSKEVGKGTTDISVETVSMVNPLNKEDVSRKLLVYSNGILKETFEDIIVKKDSEDRFDKVLNKKAEDGGSYYVKVEVIDNYQESADVELPLNATWKLGQQNKEGDKMFDGFDDNYLSYDYSVGDNGIPEDGGDYLFLRELDSVDSDLANKELYDFHIIQTPDNNSVVVQDARIKLCETRGDVFTIIDSPEGLTKKEVIDWHNGIGRGTPIDSNYAAVYWPWCKVFDTTSGKGRYAWVMPSLVMAPLYARVDRTVGSQAAPAGENNGVLPVIDIERYPSSADRDELYVNYNRINPLVKFKDGTVLAYGEKTTQRKESVLTKIHTRRMLIQIKKQCRTALRGYLFEPNTVDFLGKISNNITAILEGYKANGGLNFYKVVCDETNNPMETRQQDIINVDVALVPQGTIEQININLTLNKSDETIAD